jgi:hypothetical protein
MQRYETRRRWRSAARLHHGSGVPIDLNQENPESSVATMAFLEFTAFGRRRPRIIDSLPQPSNRKKELSGEDRCAPAPSRQLIGVGSNLFRPEVKVRTTRLSLPYSKRSRCAGSLPSGRPNDGYFWLRHGSRLGVDNHRPPWPGTSWDRATSPMRQLVSGGKSSKRMRSASRTSSANCWCPATGRPGTKCKHDQTACCAVGLPTSPRVLSRRHTRPSVSMSITERGTSFDSDTKCKAWNGPVLPRTGLRVDGDPPFVLWLRRQDHLDLLPGDIAPIVSDHPALFLRRHSGWFLMAIW